MTPEFNKLILKKPTTAMSSMSGNAADTCLPFLKVKTLPKNKNFTFLKIELVNLSQLDLMASFRLSNFRLNKYLINYKFITVMKMPQNLPVQKSDPKLFKWALVGVMVAGASYFAMKKYR